MTQVVSRDDVIWAFGPDLEPVLEVEPGTTVRFETNDCFSGQIRTEDDLVTEIDFERVNSATGPVAVTGAQPGDSLGGFGGCQGPQTRMERKASVWMEGNLGTSRY